LLGSLLAASLLAGCAEGTRTDAERGKEEDKKRDSVVDALQATETYRIVNRPGGTPTPAPEE
jgi:type I site-specific restriction endonuclease